MTLVSTKSPPPRSARAIVQRTRGRAQGFATRLMSPSDFGEILKPFVFLDFFDHAGAPFTAGLHPRFGIATLSYIVEGSPQANVVRVSPGPEALLTSILR